MNQLYEQDFCLWVENTVNLLKQKKFNNIDWKNLIEEIESLGKSERNALKSNLRVLLRHLLKWQYQPNKRSNSWNYTISEHSIRITEALADSPSLKAYFTDIWQNCYSNARNLAAKETGLDINLFPVDCPFSQEEILNPEYVTEK
ncbi:MAG TPA: DUF29 domain-containing protein [Xenococcaceae cyanobacterium]|jgi:hypothetical protein